MIESKLVTREKTNSRFEGSYDGHDIELWRDKDHDGDFYIIVTAPSGVYEYDGWWDDSLDATVDDAIKEAIQGAML